MKKININGTTYLGKIVKDGETTTLNAAMETHGEITMSTLGKYLSMKNEGTLEEGLEFTGQGGLFGVANLSPAEKIDLKVCKLKLKRAKAVTAARAENAVFSEMLGKQ